MRRQRGRSVSRVSWCEGVVLVRRWWRHSVSYVACGWRWTRQREGWCRRAPGSADKLGNVVQQVDVEIVD